jgi:hypothetical protein
MENGSKGPLNNESGVDADVQNPTCLHLPMSCSGHLKMKLQYVPEILAKGS